MTDNQNFPVAMQAGPRNLFEKIERFQSMSAGMYWRALVPIDRYAIPADCVLLLKSIRWVDDKPHTLILEPHPLKVGRSETHKYLDPEGNEKSVWVKNDEHRFLVPEFLNLFEFEPDAVAIRDRELGQVQAEITTLQQELADINTDPTILSRVVYDKLKDDEPELLRLCIEQSNVPAGGSESVALTVGDAVSRGISRESIDSMTGVINKEKRVAEIKSQWIQAKTEQIASTVKRMVPFFSEKAKAALALTEEQTTKANALLEGVASLELYIGTNVKVERIATGSSAPASEKLTFVQRKLFADEELCLWADVDENFDFQRDEMLVNALATEAGFAHQIFPAQRCVLVMAITRKSLDYGNAIVSAKINQLNHEVFLLIRDGENIFRVYSPVESHLKSGNLFPSKDEQGRCFAGLDGSTLTFEDVQYTDGLKRHDIFALHYKRFLLLVAGLDSREKLFGEFYPGEHSLEFMTLGFQEEHFAFIHDEDGEGLIEGDKRPSLDTWMAEKNKFLRSGSRVLCNWYSLMTPDSAPGACKPDALQDGFSFTARPADNFGFAVVEKDGDHLVVKVRVFKSYSEGPRSDFLCKVSLTEFRVGYWHYKQLPFLCLDMVSPEEVKWYMQKREVRKERHVEYIRFFKHALRFLEAEVVQQQGTRAYLKSALEAGGVAEGHAAEQLVGDAVTAWRAANRGADLPTIESDKAGRPWKSLLDQMYMLATDSQGRIEAAEACARKLGYQPIRLVLSGRAKLVLYAAPNPDEVDDRLVKNVWLHRITLRTSRTGAHEVSRTWALLPVNTAAETIIHQWGDPDDWVNPDLRLFQTIGQKKAAFEHVDSFKERLNAVLRCSSEEAYRHSRQQWGFARNAGRGGKTVREPSFVLPIAVVANLSSATFSYLAMCCTNPVTLLREQAPSEAEKHQLLADFIRRYENEEYAANEFYGTPSWSLIYVEPSEALTQHSGFALSRDINTSRADDQPSNNSLLSVWFRDWAIKTGQKDNLVTGYAKGLGIDELSQVMDLAEFGASVDTSLEQYNVRFMKAHEVEVKKGDAKASFHMCEVLPVALDSPGWNLGSFGCHSGSYSNSFRTCYGVDAAMALVARKGKLLGLEPVEIGPDGIGSFTQSSIAGSRRFIFQ